MKKHIKGEILKVEVIEEVSIIDAKHIVSLLDKAKCNSVCVKCGAKVKHLRDGLCYGCTMLKG